MMPTASRFHSASAMNRVLAAAIALTIVVGGAACGKDNARGASDAKVTLAFSAWPGWFPWQVAQEQGLFKANGVDVELKYFDNYLESLTALSTGNVTANSQTLNDT